MNKHYHFIGICGIGMSGIAKILRHKNITVSGCDQTLDSARTQELINLGCTISNHQGPACNQELITTIVRSSDVSLNHPEIIAATQRNISIMHRAEMLALLMNGETGIAIAGAHGKTTTTAMISHIFLEAKLDPSIVVGGQMTNINSNAHAGSGNFFIAEADESDRSFLLLPKKYCIITNIDREHLNTYTDINDIKETFIRFANTTEPDGTAILCLDDIEAKSILPSISSNVVTYGTDPASNFLISNIKLDSNQSQFSIIRNKEQTDYILAMTGIHNILNATAAIAMATIAGISQESIKFALQSFSGVDRRFTFKGISKKHLALIFDDYGHHPTELAATFNIAYQKKLGKIIMVFQPQRHSRTSHLWNEFITTFTKANVDHIIITDIFPANELAIAHISSENLVKEINTRNPQALVEFIPFDQEGSAILKRLDSILSKDDIVLLQGAGKVNKLASKLIGIDKNCQIQDQAKS